MTFVVVACHCPDPDYFYSLSYFRQDITVLVYKTKVGMDSI